MKPSNSQVAAWVREAATDLGEVLVAKVPQETLAATVAEVIEEFNSIVERVRPLSPDEHGIVTLTRPRTAALLGDRVWSSSFEHDQQFAFGWLHRLEIRFRVMLALQNMFDAAPRQDDAPDGAVAPNEIASFCHDLERDLAEGFRKATGAAVVPLYDSTLRRDAQYRRGDHAAIVTVIENLHIVDEVSLTWDQVIEFRQDEEARKAYRRFVHWLDKEMVGKPVNYIADEISARQERYDWALRKHGIKRIIGALSSTLDPQRLLGVSSVGVALELMANKPIWSLLATSGLMVGQAALSLATVLLERYDLASTQSEISYVTEVRKIAK